jgi:phosphoglucosamine mutase
MHKYFGTDGIRGIVGEFPITPDFAMRLGYAVGRVLSRSFANPQVVIGKDTRISGYLFESSLEAGFSYAGVNVYMAGPIPTPAVAYLTKKLGLSAGVVISASHNPYTDNGIKLFSANGSKLSSDVESAIEKELANPMLKAPHLGKVFRLEESRQYYIDFCKKSFPQDLSLNGLKIVLDCANGATYQVAPSIFSELGANVIKLACCPDGVNINHKCGSMHPEMLVESVISNQADYGIAFDGDGDRVLFVDKLGKIYNGDKLTYIILQSYLLQNKVIPGIVGTIMTNLGMEEALHKNGLELVRARVGDKYVLEELNRRNWFLGGEASGHILCLEHHTTGDGIISALQVLSVLKQQQANLDALIDWEEYPQTMINVHLPSNTTVNDWNEKAESIIQEAELALKDTGRIIVRPSGTEPVVRVMVEAKTKNSSQQWAEKIAQVIKNS